MSIDPPPYPPPRGEGVTDVPTQAKGESERLTKIEVGGGRRSSEVRPVSRLQMSIDLPPTPLPEGRGSQTCLPTNARRESPTGSSRQSVRVIRASLDIVCSRDATGASCTAAWRKKGRAGK